MTGSAEINAQLFERRVRDHAAAINARSPCVLDITPDNALAYSGFSSWEKASLDFQHAFGTPRATDIEEVLERDYGLADSFRVRNQLVNFKKVCLNIYNESAEVLSGKIRYRTIRYF